MTTHSRSNVERFSALACARLLLAALALSTFHGCHARRGATAASDLEPNWPTTIEVRGDEPHWHDVLLDAGSLAEVRLLQQGVDVVAEIHAPDSTILTEIDSPTGEQGTEYISIIAVTAGRYRIAVKPYEKAAAGSYVITLAVVRPATDGDRARVEAEWKAHAAYMRSQTEGTLESFRASTEAYESLTEIFRAAGDDERTAATLGYVGVNAEFTGQMTRARDAYSRAAEMWRRLDAPERQAYMLHNLGNVHFILGDISHALQTNVAALELARAVKSRDWEGHILTGLGQIYDALDQRETAVRYYQEAVDLSHGAHDRAGEAHGLTALADLDVSMDRPSRARQEIERVLALRRESHNRKGEARALRSLGDAYRAEGQLPLALDTYDQAAALQRTIGDRFGEALSLHDTGIARELSGDDQAAVDALQKSASLSREIGAIRVEADSLYRLARISRKNGRLNEARPRIEEAIALAESPGAGALGTFFRAAYIGTSAEYSGLAVDLLVDMHLREVHAGFAERAFEERERIRARSLLEQLHSRRSPANADSDVARRLRDLRAQIDGTADFLTKLQGRAHSPEDLGAVQRALQDQLTQYQGTLAEQRNSDPRFRVLLNGDALAPRTVQRQLGKSELLLEYALGEERSYLWAITRNSIELKLLPPKATIERAATLAYAQLSKRSDERSAPARSAKESMGSLVSMLGLDSAAVENSKVLIVVPDGALERLPFAALPEAESTREYRPLALAHDIVFLPSASFLVASRTQNRETHPTAELLAVADPVFDGDDPRIATREGKAKDAGTPEPSSSNESWDLPRLLYTRREAKAVMDLAGRPGSRLAMDFDANERLAAAEELAKYRVIHFATHAFADAASPELSGVVLSRFDERGGPEPGILRLYQIEQMHLAADLVVLSACQTALGSDIRGDGPFGLARGFMLAGAARVVASLWKVDDRATFELMQRFYGSLKRGLTASAALQSAQRQMFLDPDWQDPQGWGAFVLEGEPL